MDFYFQRSYRGPLKAAIFDWAGTTQDHGCFAPAVVFIEVFQKHGVPISIEQAREPMGLAKKEHIRTILTMEPVARAWEQAHGRRGSNEDVDSLYAEFIPLQLKCLSKYAALIPGTLETIRECRHRKMKIGTSTGYNREMMEICIQEGHEQGYDPDFNVCASDVPAGRPEPWMALVAAMNLRVFPLEACVKIGDTPADILEGLNAGMWSVGVAVSGNEMGASLEDLRSMSSTEYAARRNRAYQRLTSCGAHYVVDSISEIPGVLDQINACLARGDKP